MLTLKQYIIVLKFSTFIITRANSISVLHEKAFEKMIDTEPAAMTQKDMEQLYADDITHAEIKEGGSHEETDEELATGLQLESMMEAGLIDPKKSEDYNSGGESYDDPSSPMEIDSASDAGMLHQSLSEYEPVNPADSDEELAGRLQIEEIFDAGIVPGLEIDNEYDESLLIDYEQIVTSDNYFDGFVANISELYEEVSSSDDDEPRSNNSLID